jgi:transmembrane sensor
MPANDIESDAAQWLIRLEGDPSPKTRSEFEGWLAADPRHQAAFIRMEKTWRHADIVQRLKPLDGIVDEQVLEKFGQRAPNFRSTDWKDRGKKTLWLAVAASFFLAAVGGAIWLLVARAGWQVYQTEFGGFQRVVLADGSTATLNTDSRIRVRMTSGRRDIMLDKGEALFAVTHDVRRPFDVTAADTVVRAVGTAFSVRLRDHRQVDILVTEGRVAIDPTDDSIDAKLPQSVPLPTISTLSAGETISVQEHRRLKVQKVADEDVTHKLAWTQGRIWFDRARLAEAVAEFNRYNRRQLVIDDPAVASIRIGGAFEATDLDSFIAAVETFGIRAIVTSKPANNSTSELIHLVKDKVQGVDLQQH